MSNELDLSYLEEVTGGSSEMIVEMLELFKNETPEQLSSIEENIANQDWDKVRAEAHKLKPTFQYVGMESSYQLITAVETNARNREQLDTISELTDSIKRNFEKALKSIESRIEELRS